MGAFQQHILIWVFVMLFTLIEPLSASTRLYTSIEMVRVADRIAQLSAVVLDRSFDVAIKSPYQKVAPKNAFELIATPVHTEQAGALHFSKSTRSILIGQIAYQGYLKPILPQDTDLNQLADKYYSRCAHLHPPDMSCHMLSHLHAVDYTTSVQEMAPAQYLQQYFRPHLSGKKSSEVTLWLTASSNISDTQWNQIRDFLGRADVKISLQQIGVRQ